MSKVAIVRDKDTYNAVKRAIKHLGELRSLGFGSGKILLKPNLTLDVAKQKRACTNPEVIASLIDLVREAGGEPCVGESSMVGCNTMSAYDKSGLKEVCEEKNVPFIDFNSCETTKIILPHGVFIKEIVVPKEIFSFHKIISVPVLKTHLLAGVTLGLKNMKGMQYGDEKIKLHSMGLKMLHTGIVDINTNFNGSIKSIRPDLVVVDGSYAQEGEGPIGGDIIKMDVIIAGTDAVATDATACRIMKINPYDIAHIKMAWERGLGEINKEKIEILGERIEDVAKEFSYPHHGVGKLKYIFYEFGTSIVSRLKGTTEEERVYKILTDILRTKPEITKKCTKCMKCLSICPNNAISFSSRAKIDYEKCTGCMICMEGCPVHAIATAPISLPEAAKEMTVTLLRAGIKAISGKL